jgi:PncC family amidohydrolase
MAGTEREIGDLLRQKGLTLGVVESATGGLISHLITNVPGSSDYYKGSVTAYSNETKIKVVGVKAGTIEQNGAVSHEVAEVSPGRKGQQRVSRWGCSIWGCLTGVGLTARGMNFTETGSRTKEARLRQL